MEQYTNLNNRAPIERLPTELLHKIFFQCLEINLPRASIHLASALSNQTIYTWLTRLAFASNNPSSKTGIFTYPFLPLDYHSLNTTQRAELQTEILKCRWCTTPLFRRCQREYVEHILATKCSSLIMSPQDRAQLNNLDHFWQTMNRFDVSPHGRRGRGDLTIPARDPITDEPLKITIWFNFGAVQIREPSPLFHETDLFRLPCSSSLTEPARMPDKLLEPPWTAEKLELLILLSSEAYIDLDDGFERSKGILRRLIQERDFDTFQRFLSMHLRVKLYGYPLRWPVRPNHFRLAARCAESDDDPFLRLLFDQRREDIPVADKSIRAL